jgi:uncharacterized protein (TIGR00255 family)
VSVNSMTGFGKGEAENSNYSVSVEVKSVNHRFRDVRIKMSSLFSSIELDLKKQVSGHFKRGSFDVYVNYKGVDKLNKLNDLDNDKIKLFVEKMSLAVPKGVNLTVNPTDFLRSEFYIDFDENKLEVLKGLVVSSLDIAMANLSDARSTEGWKLGVVIKNYLSQYVGHLKEIKKYPDGFKEEIKNKLLKVLKENEDIELDNSRYMQEVVYYLEKMDITEELDRIDSHLEKFETLLSSSDEIGRQIDFTIQELNRETNTIGSKSNKKEISNLIVQMKVCLEKIREQGLNIE